MTEIRRRPGLDVRDWNAADLAVLRELHTALGEILTTRRNYDALRRPRLPER